MLKWFKWLVFPSSFTAQSSMHVEIGRPVMIAYSLLPSNTTNQKINWSSADTSIATVDSNWIVSGVAVWNTTITWVTEANWLTQTIPLSVTVIYVTWVTLNESSINVNAWESFQLTATVSPSDASNKNVTWSSSNTSVAVVDWNWLVTYVWDWNATITCTTVDGWYTATCAVTCVSFIPVDTCFGCTWAEQSILLKAHTYCLEVWWAQWANSWWKWWYSWWCITLSSDTCVYIYVWWCWCFNSGSAFNWWWRWSVCTWRWWWWGWWTDIRIGWNTLYHRRIVAGWWWWKDASWNCCAWWVWWWCTWWTVTNWKSSSAAWCWWTQTSGWGYIANWAAATWSWFWVWWYWNCSDSTNYAINWWWGWWYWWWWWQANSWWWGSWYVYTSSTCSNAPSWYCHCTSYYLTNACSCCWAVSFPSPSWWTETGHDWHWCVRIRSL